MAKGLPVTLTQGNFTIRSKLGTTPYLLVVDQDDMSFEVLDGPSRSLGSGAGVQALSIVLGSTAT